MMSLLLAALNSLVQAFDLWSTSEVLKSGKGHEENPRMVAVASDYWKLAGIKGLMAVLAWMPPALIYYLPLPDWAVWVLIATQVWQLYRYAPIMAKNWKIYKGQ